MAGGAWAAATGRGWSDAVAGGAGAAGGGVGLVMVPASLLHKNVSPPGFLARGFGWRTAGRTVVHV